MSKRFRILSLDGGGIRGLMTAVWLERLQTELGSPLRDHFDIIAGTSTGGILACAVAMGMPPEQVAELYRSRASEIFPGLASRLWSRMYRLPSDGPSMPKYDDVGVERVLHDELKDWRMSDVPADTLLLVPAYDTLRREALVLKSNHPEHKALYLWEIAKASCSAPAYFPAHELWLPGGAASAIDGGVVANNPTACAIAEAVRVNNDRNDPCKLADFVVASFGTGQSTRPITIEEARRWGALDWAVPLIDVLMDGAADATNYIASYLITPEHYFRFQTRLSAAYDDLDRVDQTNLTALENQAHQYLEHEGGKQKLEQLAKLLRAQR